MVPGIKPYEEPGYWRDVGELEAYWRAHMDLLGETPAFDLDNRRWPIHAGRYDGPPARIIGGEFENAQVGEGSLVVRATIRNSILGRGVWVNEGAVIEDSIVMDFTSVGKGAHLRRAIVDRYNIIPAAHQLGLDSGRRPGALPRRPVGPRRRPARRAARVLLEYRGALTPSRRRAMQPRAVAVRPRLSRLFSGRVGCVCAAALLAGCVSAVTSRMGDAPTGGRPGVVTVLLTSSVRWEPRSREQMLEPRVKAAIAACEQSGETGCGSRAIPGEPREQFSQSENERVHIFVTLGDVEPGRSYEMRVRWFGPDGGVTARMTKRLFSPELALPGFVLTGDFWLEVRTIRPGRWRVEIAVNGEVEADRTFEVVASARAHGAPLAPRGGAS